MVTKINGAAPERERGRREVIFSQQMTYECFILTYILIDVISIYKAFFTSQRRLFASPHSATMTVYARVARTAGRTAVRAQRRQMGGSHAPAPEWTGIDKVVRGYFPEDYQREFYVDGGSYRLLASPTPA